jgi:hypothetical protein
VCFTDIPLILSAEHCKGFGHFGIGFSKERMMSYGANPVLYTTPEMNERVEKYIELFGRLQGEEVDREWRDATLNDDVGDRYQFSTEQFYAMSELAGFMQNYKYNDESVDYYQREWRINEQTLPRVFGGKEQTIPGQGAIYGAIGKGDRKRITYSMMYDLNDIDFIVVPREYALQAEELVKNLRAVVKIYENNVG